jgi:hypothetical protein
MSIYRVQHNKNYTVINNTICKDTRLSWKAKGIWLYAFSRPDDWQFNLQDLVNQSSNSRDSVRNGLLELENTGYLVRTQTRENGKFGCSEWMFFEVPQDIKEMFTKTDFPDTVIANAEKPTLLSTDSLISTELEDLKTPTEDLDEIKLKDKTPIAQRRVVFRTHGKKTISRSGTELIDFFVADGYKLDEIESVIMKALSLNPIISAPMENYLKTCLDNQRKNKQKEKKQWKHQENPKSSSSGRSMSFNVPVSETDSKEPHSANPCSPLQDWRSFLGI